MSVLTVKPKFLYPHSRQFPFDEVAEKIVRELKKRNFDIPGIEVELDSYGSGEEKYIYVSMIKGADFKLWFCRVQGQLSKSKNDIAAIHEIKIPRQELCVYEDESGPTYRIYVGDDWEKDKEWFFNTIKIHAKLRGESKKYLIYSGNTYKSRAVYLLPDKDLGREYEPEEGEPQRIEVKDVFSNITEYLTKNVLEYILKFPEAEVIVDPKIEEVIPYKGKHTLLYSLCNGKDKYIIDTGKKNPLELPPEKRCVRFGMRGIWCDINTSGKITREATKSDFLPEVVWNMDWMTSLYIVAIRPKYANGIFVIDESKFEERRQELFKQIAPRDTLTDEELDSVYDARKATEIPVNDYKGDYKKPIVIITRELDFDEIEWVSEMSFK